MKERKDGRIKQHGKMKGSMKEKTVRWKEDNRCLDWSLSRVQSFLQPATTRDRMQAISLASSWEPVA